MKQCEPSSRTWYAAALDDFDDHRPGDLLNLASSRAHRVGVSLEVASEVIGRLELWADGAQSVVNYFDAMVHERIASRSNSALAATLDIDRELRRATSGLLTALRTPQQRNLHQWIGRFLSDPSRSGVPLAAVLGHGFPSSNGTLHIAAAPAQRASAALHLSVERLGARCPARDEVVFIRDELARIGSNAPVRQLPVTVGGRKLHHVYEELQQKLFPASRFVGVPRASVAADAVVNAIAQGAAIPHDKR